MLSGAARAESAAAPATADMPWRQRPITDDVIYFVMPDRFDNGSSANDRGGLDGDRLRHGFDPAHKGFFHGGDLKGLMGRLDYLQDLGITAIWMTPIFKNKPVQGIGAQASAGYHGYWVTDFTRIDPHLGTNADLKALVDAAHARGMKVFFDIITNHTADVIKYRQCLPEAARSSAARIPDCPYLNRESHPYTTRGLPDGPAINRGFRGDAPPHQTAENFARLIDPAYAYTPYVPASEKSVKVPDWLNDPIYYHNRGDSHWEGESALFGDFAGLDDLFTEHPRVLRGMIDIHKFWISEVGIDGFRIDTVKHVGDAFWRAFIPAIRKHARQEGIPDFYIFGEVYEPDPVVLSRHVREAGLPQVLDFPFQSAAQAVFADGAPTHKLATLFAADALYGGPARANRLPVFLGNHDMGRIGRFIRQSDRFMTDEERLNALKTAHAFLFFARGVPVIYYGDEQGFTGDGNDQDAREDMMPSQVASYRDNRQIGTDATPASENFDTSHPLYAAIRAFSGLYKAHPALRRGVQTPLYATRKGPGLFVLARRDSDSGESVLFAVNTARSARSTTVATSAAALAKLGGDGTMTATGDGVTVQVPALSFALYRRQP
ncbi:alpha-amylase family glycosyl hydrolase [Yunchengibacter salinarum]|uniref:alpha-amylase family glycosyl hydrolase n=1 Tax=Yunchengibacter salinarum TaxID=3133399 RepID=UPI0035B694BE